MEFIMKKTILFLGLATMVLATPVFAAAKVGTPAIAKHYEAMCILHGKKVHCAHHVMHKAHTLSKAQVAAKKK
jgi:hypothetical protein